MSAVSDDFPAAEAWLEIVHPGALASIQDLGRPGLRKVGVAHAGALEPGWLRLANALAGQPENSPAIEFLGGGLVVCAHAAPLRLGLAGHFPAAVVGPNGIRQVASWQSITLAPGETLRCKMPAQGRLGYLALAGLRVAQQFGSASTYPPAALGGLDGQPLRPGARLPAIACSGIERQLPAPPPRDLQAIRVVLGPQQDHFEEASLVRFLAEPYLVTAAADRMGMRLAGALLSHRPERGADIVSDATVPGSIQVPGHGQPIVLLADAQTVGGYAKIATVISADLPRLAVMAPGESLRFAAVSVAGAQAAARARAAALRALIAGIVPQREAGRIDLAAIYAANLVSGAIDALAAHAAQAIDAS